MFAAVYLFTLKAAGIFSVPDFQILPQKIPKGFLPTKIGTEMILALNESPPVILVLEN